MAQSMPILQKTFLAAGDLSALQWTFVKMSGNQTVTGCAAGNQAIGVLTNMPAAIGLGAVVRLLGTTKLKVDGTAGGGISAGSPLKAGTGGVGVVSTGNKETVGAIALQGSSASGDIIEALLVTYITTTA